MQETEGVIKYHLDHKQTAPSQERSLSEINSWRNLLYKLELIGQNPTRYLGYGYGNISQRYSGEQFIISGTQTGGIAQLLAKHYCLIEKVDLVRNQVNSSGPCQPSSESLTHASVYQQNNNINCVIHAHSPEIWHATQHLALPHTSSNIAYGTPEMAQAVTQLFKDEQFQQQSIFTMLGHEDGVIAFGIDFPSTACSLITLLAACEQLSLPN